MSVVIIKYNAGNIKSVTNALNRLGVEAEVTADPEKIRSADKVIFPGVGEASSTMKYLRKHQLDKLIVSLNSRYWAYALGCSLCAPIPKKATQPALAYLMKR
jgi:imidazole glycerol-phosphate synthase subunit HisH